MSERREARVMVDSPATLEMVEEALRGVWAAANQLSRVAPARPSHYSVTIFGSARIRPDHQLYHDVKRLSRALSELRCRVITGGGPGLMQAANEGARLGDPDDVLRSIGIRVELPFEQGANPFVEQVYTHGTFFSRLHQFVRLSQAFVVVAGGIGTLLETAMVWQLLQVRHIRDIPLILVGPMWRELAEWIGRSMAEHQPALVNRDDTELALCVDTVDEAVALLRPHIATFYQE
jgi:uncharacterized protein (TIGR00730 family)